MQERLVQSLGQEDDPPPLPQASHAGMCCGLRFEAQDLNAKSLGAAFLRHSLSSLLFCLYRAEEVLDA